MDNNLKEHTWTTDSASTLLMSLGAGAATTGVRVKTHGRTTPPTPAAVNTRRENNTTNKRRPRPRSLASPRLPRRLRRAPVRIH